MPIKDELILKEIPALYSAESSSSTPMQSTAYAKVFGPGRYTYFITEFDGDDTVFGYCVSALGSDCDEWGYASVSEWQNLKFPLTISVDAHFEPDSVEDALRIVHKLGLTDSEQYA